MTQVYRATFAGLVALLIAVVPAAAVWVDPIVPQASPAAESTPPPVERVESKVVAAPLPLLPEPVVLGQALAAADAHLLITGRPVQLEDGTVAPEPDPLGPLETPLHYHPATLFEGIMGVVIVSVALALVWLPRLRGRRHGHRRGSRREGRHRRMAAPAIRDEIPEKVRTRVRRRRHSRRATAG